MASYFLSMRIIFLFIFFTGLISCKGLQEKYYVEITNKVDPDIVLVNLGEADRSTIGKLLLSINRCHPSVIGIDAWFLNERDQLQDSALIIALDSIRNDVLAYYIDSTGNVVYSHTKFGSLADQGLTEVQIVDGLIATMCPIQEIDKNIHELFPLKVIKHWRPGFRSTLKTNEIIHIKFTRTLDQFFHFDHSAINEIDSEALRNKIVLIGYLGPTNEDKKFTPIRLVRKYNDNDPDTYGLVVIANQIRTILEYEKK